MVETKKTSAQVLSELGTVEIPIPGSDEKAKFRRITGYDLAAADMIPNDVFARAGLTEAQKQALILEYLEKQKRNPKLYEIEERAVSVILVRCSIANPKILAESGVTDFAKNQITITDLGALKTYFFNELWKACGFAEAAESLKEFRQEQASDAAPGCNGETIRTEAESVVSESGDGAGV